MRWPAPSIRFRLTGWYALVLSLMMVVYATATFVAVRHEFLEQLDAQVGLRCEAGCRVDIWRTTYYHALSGGAEAVVEWFKGSGLRPFIAPLGDEEREEFLMRYRSAVARARFQYPVNVVLEHEFLIVPHVERKF